MYIKDFRRKHPELSDISDFELTKFVRDTQAPDADLDEFATFFLGEAGVGEWVKQRAKDLAQGVVSDLIGGGMKGLSAVGGALSDKITGEQTDPREGTLFQAGETMQQGMERVFPTDPRLAEDFSGQVARGLGQFAGMAGGAAITAPLKAARWIAPAAAGVGMTAGEGVEDALRHGATLEQVDTAALVGAGAGLTEFAPIMRAFNRLRLPTDRKAVQVVANALAGGVEEALQESTQQGILNAYASMSYDEKRSLLDDLGESAAVGGTVGFIANAMLSAIGLRRRGGVDTGGTEPVVSPTTEAPPTRAPAQEGVVGQEAVTTTEQPITTGEAVSTAQPVVEKPAPPTAPAPEQRPSEWLEKTVLQEHFERTPDEAATSMALVRALAEARGEDVDTFINQTIADSRQMESPGQAQGLMQEQQQGLGRFYSELSNFIGRKMMGTLPAVRAENMLKSGAIKAEELEWSGVLEYLALAKEQGRKVTGEELQRVVQEKGVRLEEVDNKQIGEVPPELQAAYQQAEMNHYNEKHKFNNIKLEDYLTFEEYLAAVEEQTKRVEEAFEQYRQVSSELDRASQGSNWYGMQMEGEKNNYRELSLILPFIPETPSIEVFEASHNFPKNTLAWVRADERQTLDGKAVSFINEMQSDWHQQGNKKGYGKFSYQNPEDVASVFPDEYKQLTEAGYVLDFTDGGSQSIAAWFTSDGDFIERSDAPQYLKDMAERIENGVFGNIRTTIPNAPFKGTAWAELALKRMVIDAVETGKDYVAWPATAQQVAQIEKWNDLKQSASGRWFTVGGTTDVTGVIDFYTKTLPNIAKKLANKTGLRLTKTTVKGDQTVNALEITQSARDKILGEGLSLFQQQGRPSGMVTFAEDGRAILTAFKGATDFSTFLHEIGHIMRRQLTPEQLAVAERWAGVEKGEWTVAAEEKFARGWEQYLRHGRAPMKALRGVFEALSTALRRVYRTLRGTPLDVHISKEMRQLFDSLLVNPEYATRKRANELSLEAWKKAYGKDIEIGRGMREGRYNVRVPSRYNQLSFNITKHSMYLTPGETAAQQQVVGDPQYLSDPRVGWVDRMGRALNKIRIEALAAFHAGEDVQTMVDAAAQVKGRLQVTGETLAIAQQLTELQSFLRDLSAYVAQRQAFALPARVQLQAFNEATGRQHVMNRKTGKLYAVERMQGSRVLLEGEAGYETIAVHRDTFFTDFIQAEQISETDGKLLSRDEWLTEQHYQEVLHAIEQGETVTKEALSPHINRDPFIQKLYNETVETEGAVQDRAQVQQLFQEQDRLEQPSSDWSYQYETPRGASEETKSLLGNINQASYFLEGLANVLDKEGRTRLDSAVPKVELQRLARVSGDVGQMTMRDYLAAVQNRLDTLADEIREEQTTEERAQTAGAIAETYKKLREWYEGFENRGEGDLLLPGKTEDQVRKLWFWFNRSVLKREPNPEGKIARFLHGSIQTMHWMQRRFPVLTPLYRLGSVDRFNKASTTISNILNGSPDTETMQVRQKDGSYKTVQIRLPGLHSISNLPSRGPVYKAFQKMVLLSDDPSVRRRLTTEEIMAGEAIITLRVEGAAPTRITFDSLQQLTEQERAQVAKAYQDWQDTSHWMYYKLYQNVVEQFGEHAGADIMGQISPEGYIEGYFPHLRSGQHGLLVVGPDKKTKHLSLHRNRFDLKKAMDEVRAQYPGDTVTTIDPSNTIQYQIGGGTDLIAALDQVLAKVDLEGIAGEALSAELEGALREATAELIKSQGLFGTFKVRQDIPGFDERVKHVIFQYVHNYGASLAKIDFAKGGAQELAKLRAQPHLYNKAREWYHNMMQAADVHDRFVGKLRAFIFMHKLGFNVKTALVVFADKYTNAPSVLGRYTKGAFKKMQNALNDTATGFKPWKYRYDKLITEQGLSKEEAINQLGLPKGISLEELHSMLWSWEAGATTAKFTPELLAREETGWEVGTSEKTSMTWMGKLQQASESGLRRAFDASAWMLVQMESLNRMSTYLAAYRIFRGEKGWDVDRARLVAQDVVNDAHYMYGKPNLPAVFQTSRLGKYLRAAYTFRSFEHNYIQMLADMAMGRGMEGKKLALQSLAVLSAFGGAVSLPFFMVLAKALGAIGWDDPEQEIRRLFNEMDSSETLAGLFSDGLPSLAGVSLQSSLAVGRPMDLEEFIGGVAGAMVRDLADIRSGLASGDYDDVVKKALPVALANFYRGAQGAQQGVVTRSGTPLRENLIGEQIKYTPYEMSARFLGFQIEREARTHRLREATIVEQTHWKNKRDSIYTRIGKGIKLDDKAMLAAAIRDAVEYERERVRSGKIDMPAITRDSIRNSLSESGLQKRRILQVVRMTGSLQ